MPKLVIDGATIQCDQGAAPAKLVVLPVEQGDIDGKPLATTMDHVPMVNIPSFGMCRSQPNPAVAAATAAAMGTPTPAPCVPVTPAPWSPGSSLGDLRGKPLLTSDSTCKCQWAGEVSIADPAAEVEVES